MRRKKVWEGVEEEKKEEMRRKGRQEEKNTRKTSINLPKIGPSYVPAHDTEI